MRAGAIIGIVLIVAGALALVYQGITYSRDRTVLDVGPITATAETRETIPIPPVLGGLAIAGGVVLLLMSRRQRS
ncbi:MAG TPA: hypothetical protein VMM77_07930 [Gemmatimonadaceae bacterium]|nr:hypothetical protein [Gemmatimonadaceae bacterium]